MMIDVVESALVQYAEVKSVVALQDWFTCSSSCRAWNSMLLCNRLHTADTKFRDQSI